MAIIHKLPIIILLPFLLSIHITVSAEPPENSPSPSPEFLPPTSPPSPDSSPAPAPTTSPSDQIPAPVTSPSDQTSAPAPVVASDGGMVKDVKAGGEERESGGMSGRKKAGIALGVIAAVCVVAAAGFVYDKRRQNLRRSEYAYGVRGDIL